MSLQSLCCGFGKQVLSGDCIIIRERAREGPPTSQTILLSNILCPKVARRPTLNTNDATRDEPYGWIAREFVRSKVVGKEVYYSVESEISTDRAYGSIILGKHAGAENLANLLLSEGLASVRTNISQAIMVKCPVLKTLIEIEEKAKAEKRGIWSASPNMVPRNICWIVEDPAAFFEAHARQPLRGVVEFVRDGNTMQVQLMPISGDPTETYHNIMVIFSGIKAPASKLIEGCRVYDPFALDAQFFVESRLLQRDVTVILESFNNSMFVGSVLHPNGNVARYLLREGLAKCLEWNLAAVSPEAGGSQAYRDDERVAKDKRLRIWHDYQPKRSETGGGDGAITLKGFENPNENMIMDYTGLVVEVGMGDNLVVKCQDGVVRKFFLSSIRPPRPPLNKDGKPQQVSKPLYQVAHLYEAREFLRKRVIGKQVKVAVDYVQPKPEGSTFDDRAYATVTIGDTNVAEALLQRGLAFLTRYRNPTDARSRAYDALVAAEAHAQKKLVGLFDTKPASMPRFAELDGNIDKSRQFLYSLQRGGPSEALIEFVSSASRFRVHIYRENLLCFALAAGIVCPRATRKLPNNVEEPCDPFGDEARGYTRDLIMHREVKFEAEGMDRVGNLIGWFTLPSDVKVASMSSNSAGKKGIRKTGPSISSSNLSVILVARGYATVNRVPASKRASQYCNLVKAEQFAQSHNLGMWISKEFTNSWKDAQDSENNAGIAGDEDSVQSVLQGMVTVKELQNALPDETEKNKKTASLRLKSANMAQVTTIITTGVETSGIHFFIQWNNNAGLVSSMNRDLNLPEFPPANAIINFQPRKNMICAARFSADNLWYRARVQRYNDKTVTVIFIDFGNEEVVERGSEGLARLATLPKNLSSKEPLATRYRLAGVQLPPDSSDRTNALDCFAQIIHDQDIRVSPIDIICTKEDTPAVSNAVVYIAATDANCSVATESKQEFLDVSEEMLRDGLVFTEPCRMPIDMAIRYSEAQRESMHCRRNIWRYGDFRDEVNE